MVDTHNFSFHVAADHPSLAGHFPGRPVVPGVLVLGRVLQAIEQWTGLEVDAFRLPQVKFVAPLLPDQDAKVSITRDGERMRFSVHHGGRTIATGEMVLSP